MKEVLLKKVKFSFYDSIKSMPEARWQKAQSFLLQEYGIGSNLESINEHYKKLFSLMGLKQYPEAVEEMNNLYFNWNSFINNISFKSLALSCFVHSKNETEVILQSDDDFLKLHRELLDLGITTGSIDEILEEIKKKLLMN